jgi:hypothetical protein
MWRAATDLWRIGVIVFFARHAALALAGQHGTALVASSRQDAAGMAGAPAACAVFFGGSRAFARPILTAGNDRHTPRPSTIRMAAAGVPPAHEVRDHCLWQGSDRPNFNKRPRRPHENQCPPCQSLGAALLSTRTPSSGWRWVTSSGALEPLFWQARRQQAVSVARGRLWTIVT